MPDKYWLLGGLAILAGALFWFHLDALAYLVGAGMAAYAFQANA